MNKSQSQRRADNGLCDIPYAAEVLGVSTCTVRNYISRGLLPAHRVGPRLIRLRIKDVQAFANGHRVTV